MQRLHPTTGSNVAAAEVTAPPTDNHAPTKVIRRAYVTKRLPRRSNNRIYVSFSTFKKELHLFDPEMSQKYSNKQVVAVLSLTMLKAVDRIIKYLWRMPFPNGMGMLYMKEAQRTKIIDLQGGEILTEHKAARLMREVRQGMKRVFLKWNKDRTRFPYKDIWLIRRSEGHFRSTLYNEVITRCEDPTKPNYRGHII